ncbi:MAG: class III lanthionine synthetase LanKC, partial [Sciscionella sp.]
KFLRNQPIVMMINSKSAFRGSSGKLVTIYPTDESQLELTLKELDETLTGTTGPYILSDLRYGDGPLFIRYGGFSERHCLDDSGERVLAITDGDERLVPDRRDPTFSIPSWVTLPEFLRPHLDARNSVTTEGLPYEIESVLQFSNGGGVYLGRDTRTDEQVVLKEGRPHAGLDAAGRDAVTRLTHERDILQRLTGLDVVPALRDYFVLGDHHFVVQEFIDGNPLQRLLVHRYPLTHPDPTEQELADYTEWALEMIAGVERAVAALHERGVVFGDLHPSNILVTAEGRLGIIDFEVASLVEDNQRSTLGHPAFQSPRDRTGTDVDRYALACLRLGMFAPQTTILLGLEPVKAEHIGSIVMDTFPVPEELIREAVGTIRGASVGQDATVLADLPFPSMTSWERTRDAMRTAILASATPDRDDRLFPGDIAQFLPGGGINVAYGAAGVLYALFLAGAGQFPEHEDWLRKRALSRELETGIGFYDGLHGVGYVLELLGHRQDALDVVDLSVHKNWEGYELGLYSGLAGAGLNLLHFAALTGESEFAELASRAVEVVAERLGGPDDVPELSGGDHPRAGLMHGSSGPALLFMHAYERTGDAAMLDLAATALRQDLRRCTRSEDGTLQVDQGWRTLPYLDEGSVGIAMVLVRYLAHREDEDFAAALQELRLITRSGYFVQPGLFTGRAGILVSAAMQHGADEHAEAATESLIRGLNWHALPHAGGLAFPGEQLLRLSMDFATGTAGVLFALATALHPQPVRLPFFDTPGSSGALRTASPTSEQARRRQHVEAREEV